MNPRQFALFLAFYFYVLNVNAADDAQRVILLSSLIQKRALQAQLGSAEFAASKQLPRPIAVLRFIWVHHLTRMDVPKTGKIVPKSWIHDYQ